MKEYINNMPPLPEPINWLLFSITILTAAVGVLRILWNRREKASRLNAPKDNNKGAMQYLCNLLYALYVAHYRPSLIVVIGLRSMVSGLLNTGYFLFLVFFSAWFYSSGYSLVASLISVICFFVLVEAMSSIRHIWQLTEKYLNLTMQHANIFNDIETVLLRINPDRKNVKRHRRKIVVMVKLKAKQHFPALTATKPESDRIF